MGTRGNSKKMKGRQGEGEPSQASQPGPKHPNRSWSDCSPAFRTQAGDLMLCAKAIPKNTAKAGRLADKFAGKYPESPLASHLAGHVQAEGEDADRALQHFRRASTLQPNCLEIAYSLASAHMALQQFGAAADECRRALAVLDPTDPALHTVAVAEPPPPAAAGPPDSSVDTAALRVVFAKERLRDLLSQVSSLPRTAGAVLQQFCSGLTELQLQSFARVPMKDVMAFYRQSASNQDEQPLGKSLEAALEFGKATKTLQYWVCPQCNCSYPNAELFSSHMEEKHIKPLPELFTCVSKRISDEQLEYLESWDPVPAPKGDSGCKKRALLLNQIKKLLVRLRGINALTVDLMNKLTEMWSNSKDSSFSEKLNTIASLETQALQTVVSRLRMIAPADWYHETKCDAEHDDARVHFRIEEETIVLDFGAGNADGSVNTDPLIRWLCKPVHEQSWTSTRQDCITNGAKVLANLEEMITSLQELIKQRSSSIDEEDYFDRKASIDVEILRTADALENCKKRLAQLCRFDYSAIIMPALKAHLNAQMSSLLDNKLDDSGVSQDLSHEQLQWDKNVSQAHQEATSLDGTKPKPDPPTKSSYATAHLNVAERAKNNFMRCLREFKLNPTESSLYPEELKAMVRRGSTTFCVYYKHTEQYDDLAMSLARSYDRIKASLQAAFIDFIKEQEMVGECMKVSKWQPRLHIDGLPRPGSIQALAVFMQNAKVVDVMEIHGNPNDIVLILTELGRNLYLGFLRAIIEQHKRRKSWNGMLSIEDLQVRDGSVFEISKEALVDATGETMAKDFAKLAELLEAFFQKDRVRPVYFSYLEDDLSRSSENLGTSASHPQTIAFQEYVLSHLALKSAMARGHLWLDLYRVFQQLGRVDQESLRTHLTGVIVPLSWTEDAENHPMLKDVLHAGTDPKGRGKGNSSSTSTKYFNHLQHLMLFMRHVVQHGPDNTKTGPNGEQKLKNLREGDLIIAKYLPKAVMYLIRFFRSNNMVHADKFSDAWTSFSSSS